MDLKYFAVLLSDLKFDFFRRKIQKFESEFRMLEILELFFMQLLIRWFQSRSFFEALLLRGGAMPVFQNN